MTKQPSKNTDLKKLANFFYEVGSLRKIARSHRQSLLTDDMSDNIASHSYRVTIIGYFLAKMAAADSGKVTQMCLFHDVGESRSGDQNWIHKRYTKTFEDEIINDQLGTLPLGEDILKLCLEYQERKTLEAKLAKDADIIDQILLLKEYAWAGNKEAAIWLKNEDHLSILLTDSGRKLAKMVAKQRPNEWWYKNLWTSKRR